MADSVIKKRNFGNKSIRSRRRSKDSSSSDENDQQCSSKIEEMKIVQKLRQRQRGVDINELGEKTTQETGRAESGDPFKVKSGGMVNMKNVTVTKTDDAYDVGIGTQFSAETNKRDEDEEMMKYIDEQVSKKASEISDPGGETSGVSSQKYYTPEEAALQAVPKHLRTNAGARSEEMLSNQMLSGIPEVDLGIESKIKNIEATEEAKLKLLMAQRNKADGPSDFVPTNMAVNFASKAEEDRRKRPHPDSRPGGAKATDDLIYARFKKVTAKRK